MKNKLLLTILFSTVLSGCGSPSSSNNNSEQTSTNTSQTSNNNDSSQSSSEVSYLSYKDSFPNHLETKGFPSSEVSSYLLFDFLSDSVVPLCVQAYYYSKAVVDNGEKFFEIFLPTGDLELSLLYMDEYVEIAKEANWDIDDSFAHWGIYELISPNSEIKVQISATSEAELGTYPYSVYMTVATIDYSFLKGYLKVRNWPKNDISTFLSSYNRTNTLPSGEENKTYYVYDSNSYLAIALPSGGTKPFTSYIEKLTNDSWEIKQLETNTYQAQDPKSQAVVGLKYDVVNKLVIWNIYPFVDIPITNWPAKQITNFLLEYDITTPIPAYIDGQYRYQIEKNFKDYGTYIAVNLMEDDPTHVDSYGEILKEDDNWEFVYENDREIPIGPGEVIIIKNKRYISKDGLVVLDFQYDAIFGATSWYITIASSITL